MNDSVMTVVGSGSQSLFGVLYALLLGGLIVPTVQWLKRFPWVGGIVDPSFVTALLAIVGALGLAHWFAREMNLTEVIQFALSALGGATLVYRGGKLYMGNKSGGGNS